jgi:hypothetical protein
VLHKLQNGNQGLSPEANMVCDLGILPGIYGTTS